MVLDEAQSDPNVVTGMFSANSFPASVLFDSRATHSFISSGFLRKHGVASILLKNNILVSSPGGEMRAEQVCPNASIVIRGIVFPPASLF